MEEERRKDDGNGSQRGGGGVGFRPGHATDFGVHSLITLPLPLALHPFLHQTHLHLLYRMSSSIGYFCCPVSDCSEC